MPLCQNEERNTGETKQRFSDILENNIVANVAFQQSKAQRRGNRRVLISGAKHETFRTSYVENTALLQRNE